MLIRLRKRTRSYPLQALTVILFSTCLISSITTTGAPSGFAGLNQLKEKTLVCVVSSESMDPVVFVELGKLTQPYAGGDAC